MADLIDSAVTTAAAGTGAGGGFFAVRWFVQWITARLDKRQAQLDAEHNALDIGWKEYRLLLERRVAQLEASMQTMERQGRAMRRAFEHATAALIRVDPGNAALPLVDKILAQAFPDDFTVAIARAEASLDRDAKGQ